MEMSFLVGRSIGKRIYCVSASLCERSIHCGGYPVPSYFEEEMIIVICIDVIEDPPLYAAVIAIPGLVALVQPMSCRRLNRPSKLMKHIKCLLWHCKI